MTMPKPTRGSYADPILLERDDLDLSGLRRHVRQMHGPAVARGGLPRTNADLAVWHAREHHRYKPGHRHGGSYVLVLRPDGRRPVGLHPVVSGWYTGREPVTP